MSKPPEEAVAGARPADAARSRYDHVRLSHGSGGKLTLELIEELFVAIFSNEPLRELTDAAILENPGGRIAFATDSHTVKPAFFPGGDIGRLAVAGTINDLAVMGATPMYMTSAFLLEEGYPMDDLERIVRSMKATADEAGVKIVAGDTKVLERGHGDGVFINTTGIGFLADDVQMGVAHVRPGDLVLVHSIPSGVVGLARYLEQAGVDPEVGYAAWVGQLGQRRADDLPALSGGASRVYLVSIHTVGDEPVAREWFEAHARRVDRFTREAGEVRTYAPRAGEGQWHPGLAKE